MRLEGDVIVFLDTVMTRGAIGMAREEVAFTVRAGDEELSFPLYGIHLFEECFDRRGSGPTFDGSPAGSKGV